MKSLTYLDTYVLQQDMRIRMPKSILSNLDVQKGNTLFDIYFNVDEKVIVLKPKDCVNMEKL
ncbi:AbrB/MazE/SpoVT family DNA-binding domain-containing protein [bacterium]|nr:AbrB/MazE/SpoVT family DNA-binding domain-containing protein [bacterium]